MDGLAQASARHREVMAFVVAAERAGVAAEAVPAVRARLLTQRAGLTETAARRGTPVELDPAPAEVASALRDLSPTAVAEALRAALSTLDEADALLNPPVPAPPARAPSPVRRNALIYGAYAAGVVVIQLVLFVLLDEVESLPLAAPFCLIVFPLLAWAAGWLTIGAVATRGADGKINRSPRLGAVICAGPDLLLCAGLGVLFLAR